MQLSDSLQGWGLEVGEKDLDDLMGFAGLVDTYTEANITGAKGLQAVVSDHVTDSLSCMLVADLARATNAIDVGSGGGFPAIPLAVSLRATRWTMVEATNKKAAFLQQALAKLELSNAHVLPKRVEHVGRMEGHRGKYDVSTARAVASLNVLVEYCVPLLRKGGVFVAMKAGISPEEIGQGRVAAQKLGAEIDGVIPVPTPPGFQARERNLVLVRKVGETSEAYPRPVGVPKKRPLGA